MRVAIQNLRQISRSCNSGQDLDPRLSQWLGETLEGFLHHQHSSLTDAFGMRQPPGGVPWWREEAMWHRDEALREFAERHFDDLSVSRRAARIRQLAMAYAASAWPNDRNRDDMPAHYAGTEEEFLWRAFKSGAPMPLGERQLRSILAI